MSLKRLVDAGYQLHQGLAPCTPKPFSVGLKRTLMLLALALFSTFASAQSIPHLKHRAFVYWGYNRAQFTTSDIHFTGTDYDFILHNVVAKDKPEAFTLGNYFKPKNIWIPQYNYRAGWFLNDHWSFSLGLDHMKYVMQADQRVQLTGYISKERSAAYATTADEAIVQLTRTCSAMSIPTDEPAGAGCGPLQSALGEYDGKRAWYLTEGLFAGLAIHERTCACSVGHNQLHLAGYGAGAQTGVRALHIAFSCGRT